jgi:hypothetical protein
MRPATCAECPHRGGSGWPEDPHTCDHEESGDRFGRHLDVSDGDPPAEWCPLPDAIAEAQRRVASLAVVPHATQEQVAALDAWTLERYGGTVPRDDDDPQSDG